MNKLKTGDTVQILSGKDRGRKGKIERLLLKEGRVLVPGMNIYKKHVKKAVAADGKGGIYEVPRPILVSKVALICPKCKKPTRVGFEQTKAKSGGIKKSRICKKCGKKIDGAARSSKKKTKK